jgi:hypothetical protein
MLAPRYRFENAELSAPLAAGCGRALAGMLSILLDTPKNTPTGVSLENMGATESNT